MKYSFLIKLILVCLLGLVYGSVDANTTEKSWRFRVLLDDSEIGHHTFNLKKQNDTAFVSIKADFDVKLLFFSVYTYEHENHETWKGKCLESISSHTNDNGEKFYVRGNSVENMIRVKTPAGTERLEGCVKTFSYWDPDFLNSERLLNAQTGELTDVRIENLGETNIEVQGKNTAARHYRLVTEEFSIDLWYSANDQEWLALQSTTSEGTVLQYKKIYGNRK